MRFVLAFIFFAAIIILPIVIVRVIYIKLKNSRYSKIAKFFVLLVCIYIGYNIYTAIYPNESFYINDYELNTKLKFPKSAKFISKDATYPDIHGEYNSLSLIKITKEEFSNLLKITNLDSSFKTDDTIYGFDSNFVVNGISKKEIIKIVRKQRIQIGFLNDNYRILIAKVN